MACYRPLRGYRAYRPGESGKRAIVFSPSAGFRDLAVDIPCGQCVGCRLEKSRQWAMRCMHEASLHDANCFLTLTYDDAHLPVDLSLNKTDWQLFAKRLRKRLGPFRFYMSGEYGEQFKRPHYHAVIFGLDFPDKKFLKSSYSGDSLYVSELLSDIWSLGYAYIGSVTFESAAYVARYIMKKITGDGADSVYGGRLPEFSLMSRRPGIGRAWIERFQNDVYPSDEVVVRGRVCRPPRYYDGVVDGIVGDDLIRDVRFERVKAGKRSDRGSDNTLERLFVREKVCEARVSLHRRDNDGN